MSMEECIEEIEDMIKLNKMAMECNKLHKRLAGKYDAFLEHLFKVYYYRDDINNQNHWLTELANYCDEFDDITLKPFNKKPSKDEFLNNLLQDVSSAKEMRVEIDGVCNLFIDLNTCDDFLKRYKRLRIELANYLSSKSLYSRSDYQNLIKKFLL